MRKETPNQDILPPDRPSFANLKGSIISIRVGPSRTKYTVHEALLTQYSAYFRARFTAGFKETGSGFAELQDVDPSIFEAFLDWLYYGRLPAAPAHWFEAEADDDARIKASTQAMKDVSLDEAAHVQAQQSTFELHLVELYAFADYFDVADLRRAIVRHVHGFAKRSSWIPWYSTVRRAYEVLPVESPFCRLLVEIHAVKYVPEGDDERERREARGLPVEFWLEVMKRLAGCRDESKWMGGVEEFEE